jgi:hypothetical protein
MFIPNAEHDERLIREFRLQCGFEACWETLDSHAGKAHERLYRLCKVSRRQRRSAGRRIRTVLFIRRGAHLGFPAITCILCSKANGHYSTFVLLCIGFSSRPNAYLAHEARWRLWLCRAMWTSAATGRSATLCLLPIVGDVKPVEWLRIRSKRARCFAETATNGTCAWHAATAAKEVVTCFRPCRSHCVQDAAVRP